MALWGARRAEPNVITRGVLRECPCRKASDSGDAKTAATLLEQARALDVEAGVRTGLDYTSAINDLGYVYYNQGRYADAYAVTAKVGGAFDRGGRGGTLVATAGHDPARPLPALFELLPVPVPQQKFHARNDSTWRASFSSVW